MTARRTTLRILTLAAPVAAAVMMAAPGLAAPPHPFGPPALTIGCPNQGSLLSLTGGTGQSGPEPGIQPGEIRFASFPAVPTIPAAGQVTVAWINTDTGQTGITNLEGAYPYLAKTVYTGRGHVMASLFGSINLGSMPLCQANPTFGDFFA